MSVDMKIETAPCSRAGLLRAMTDDENLIFMIIYGTIAFPSTWLPLSAAT